MMNVHQITIRKVQKKHIAKTLGLPTKTIETATPDIYNCIMREYEAQEAAEARQDKEGMTWHKRYAVRPSLHPVIRHLAAESEH